MRRDPNYKPEVIEKLFEAKWDPTTGMLREHVVTLEEVQRAILEYNAAHPDRKPVSARNPANFIKDIERRRRTAVNHWPRSVADKGYSAVQETGGNACFRFVKLAPGAAPFGGEAFINPPPLELSPIVVESLSLPLASKQLGRRDEPWLVQVLVRLRVIETHFAVTSESYVVQIDHLQMNVKLAQAEVDALFLAHIQRPGQGVTQAIVSCEAKSKDEDVIESQIVRQVQMVAKLRGVTQELIIPIVVKSLGGGKVHIVEFEPVNKADAQRLTNVKLLNQGVYHLKPSVPGLD